MEQQHLFAQTISGSFKFYNANGQHPGPVHLVKRCAVGALLISALVGCVPTADNPVDRLDTTTNTNEVNDVAALTEVLSQPVPEVSNDESSNNESVNNEASTDQDVSDAEVTDDVQGSSNSDSELALLLYTDFETENQQLIPTTGWICNDEAQQNRIYYFYSEGVLAASRKVVVERTLIENNSFDDITYFWEVSSTDSILLSTVLKDDLGNLLFAGEQYDVNTIRFSEIGERQTFTAQSMLRGQMACAAYNLR